MMRLVEYYPMVLFKIFIKLIAPNPLNYLQRPYQIGLYAYNFFIFASFTNRLHFVFDSYEQQRF